MEDMKTDDYPSLINDTLTYIHDLLPKKEEPVSRGLLKENNDEISHRKGLRIDHPAMTPSKVTPPPSPKPQPVVAPLPSPAPETKPQKGFFELEIPKPPAPEPTEEIQKILKEIAPDLYFHKHPLSDYKAKRIKEAWKEKRGTPAIPILFQGVQYRKFVDRIAKAIDTVYGSCRLVEITAGKKWDDFLEFEGLKLIIAPDLFIFGNKELLSFYKETPQQKVRKLGNIPLLLLPDLSLYYKDPYLKRSLWNVICNTIDSLPLS
jgi:hypothetical protein